MAAFASQHRQRRSHDTACDLSGTLRLIALSAALTITAPQMASAALLSSCGPGIAVGALTCPETVTFGSQKVEFTNGLLSLDKWLPLFPAPTDVKAPGTFPIGSNLVHHAGSLLPHPTMLAVSKLDASSAFLASPSAATPTVDLLPSVSLVVFPSAATATITLTSPVTLIAIPLDEFADLGPFEVSSQRSSTTGGGDIEDIPNLAKMPLFMGIYGFATEHVAIAVLALASLLTALVGLGLFRRRRGLH
jgi:hypothetical protein